jgi:hypothetical protein
MANIIDDKLIKHSSGVVKPDENTCSNEYDLLYYAYFVPNDFNKKVINIIGEAGFDTECEKDNFAFDYYPDEDLVIYKNNYYRKGVVSEETFNKYKDNVIFRGKTDVLASSMDLIENNGLLPWIRYPRTKDGILIPLLVEKIFNRIPSKIVFTTNQN